MSKAAGGLPHVGVVGLGIMGSAMASNMLKAGFRVTGFDVVAGARAALAKEGGKAARSAAEVARILGKTGITLMDCPLSGTGAQARVKDLLVYASGPKAAFDACAAVFPGFSRGHYYLGA